MTIETQPSRLLLSSAATAQEPKQRVKTSRSTSLFVVAHSSYRRHFKVLEVIAVAKVLGVFDGDRVPVVLAQVGLVANEHTCDRRRSYVCRALTSVQVPDDPRMR